MWSIIENHLSAPFHLLVWSYTANNMSHFPDGQVREGRIQVAILMCLGKLFEASNSVDIFGSIKLLDWRREFKCTGQGNFGIDPGKSLVALITALDTIAIYLDGIPLVVA